MRQLYAYSQDWHDSSKGPARPRYNAMLVVKRLALRSSSYSKYFSMGLANLQNGISHVRVPHGSDDVVAQKQRTRVVNKILVIEAAMLRCTDHCY